jgi:membrane-bound lytic murein transglycosylase B
VSRDDRVEMQALLSKRNLDVGEPDGVIGRRTRDAVRAFQKAEGLIADGFPTTSLLLRLRQAIAAAPAPTTP